MEISQNSNDNINHVDRDKDNIDKVTTLTTDATATPVISSESNEQESSVNNENNSENLVNSTNSSNNNSNSNNNSDDDDKVKYLKNLSILNSINVKDREYQKIKSNILQETASLRNEDLLLNDLLKERNLLVQEFNKFEAILKDIKNDIHHVCMIVEVDGIIKERNSEKNKIQKHINQLHEVASPIKDSLEELRKSVRLPPLPTIEQENNLKQTEYLNQRLNEEIETISKKQQQANSKRRKSSNS
ncbi:hypothetical protein PPL_04002 [Heterostelium album PN500]|uniref:Uncharacterized protein n=1 Tax=Heterostelium pallidum (strain ATCC 26659 / Pp 5 / PN500) TaxID=670386 RepID=D3B5R4_HETP5|nr:hypothetical protein PPL_04002 [Heterostelium album PN500]EFA83212.1 hypothetical protein PPL_04002 [Heterostelium album PN500]|eukprot:XP_020435329.1 hypothetical protein PPL_04002 [Heterostelium album PN500]